MNRLIPVRHRLRSLQDVMRTEAESWRQYGRHLEAAALEHYAQMLEKYRQQLLEEERERSPSHDD